MFLFLPDNEAVEVGDGRGEDLQPDALLAGRRDQLEHVLDRHRPVLPGYVIQRIDQAVLKNFSERLRDVLLLG